MKTQIDSGGISTERMDSLRLQFEAWIKSPPYECEVSRYPKDERNYAWHGQYKDNDVQLAWDAWCEAFNIFSTATRT